MTFMMITLKLLLRMNYAHLPAYTSVVPFFDGQVVLPHRTYVSPPPVNELPKNKKRCGTIGS